MKTPNPFIHLWDTLLFARYFDYACDFDLDELLERLDALKNERIRGLWDQFVYVRVKKNAAGFDFSVERAGSGTLAFIRAEAQADNLGKAHIRGKIRSGLVISCISLFPSIFGLWIMDLDSSYNQLLGLLMMQLVALTIAFLSIKSARKRLITDFEVALSFQATEGDLRRRAEKKRQVDSPSEEFSAAYMNFRKPHETQK